MATGAGKTTVMGMLAAWSILNKVNDRADARFSDVVLVVCPNVTIRSRLAELDPRAGRGEPLPHARPGAAAPHARPDQGRVLVTNWHVFEPQASQTGGVSARVVQGRRRECGRARPSPSAPKTTTARGRRYLTRRSFDRQVAAGLLDRARGGARRARATSRRCEVESVRYVESDTALVNRMLGREVGGKQNILVLNDEAHHAYRIRRDEPDEDEDDLFGDEDEAEEFFKEATVWVEGLDRIHKLRGINFCVDLSATPYFLGRVGPGHEPAVPVGGQRLRPDRRHRVRAGEDPAARRARHDRRGDPRLLQHLALDPAAS